MKTRKIIFIIITLLTGLLFSYCGKKKVWVAKIDGKKITLDDFNVRFEYYLKSKYMQNPEMIPQARADMEERKACLKDMINEALVLEEAKKLKIDKREEVKNLIKLYTQQIILNAYIEEFIGDSIKVSEEEINKYYNENRAQFKNVDPEFAKKRIEYQLTLLKYDKKISEILEKLRGQYKIEENENAIRPIISSAPQTQKSIPNIPPAIIKKTNK